MKTLAIILTLLAVLSTVVLLLPEQSVGNEQPLAETLLSDVDIKRFGRIRIVSWSARRLHSQTIEIDKVNDEWVLPQHHQYPADAGSTVGDLLAGFLGLELGLPISDSTDTWEQYRLYDPIEDNGEFQRACGRRVTLWDVDGKELLDIIVGAEVPGGQGQRYVRLRNDKKAYRVPFGLNLPTRFSDWVDTTLLPIEFDSLRTLKLKQYGFDEERRRIRMGVKLQFARNKIDSLWQTPNAIDGETADDAAVHRVLRAALQARIYGVKPFDRDLKNMEQYGFFANKGLGPGAESNPIVGNEGLVVIGSNDGLSYYLYLGEVVKDTSLLSGGISGNYRYVMLACGYNPETDEAYNGDNLKERMEAGRQSAGQFNKRFAKFIYIIDDEDYKRLRPDYKTMFKKIEQQQP